MVPPGSSPSTAAMQLLQQFRDMRLADLAGQQERIISASFVLYSGMEHDKQHGGRTASPLTVQLLATVGNLLDQLVDMRPPGVEESVWLLSVLFRTVSMAYGNEAYSGGGSGRPRPGGGAATPAQALIARALLSRIVRLLSWLTDAIKALSRRGHGCFSWVGLSACAVSMLFEFSNVDTEATRAALPAAVQLAAACMTASAQLQEGLDLFAGASTPHPTVTMVCEVAANVSHVLLPPEGAPAAADDLQQALCASGATVLVLLAGFGVAAGSLHQTQQRGSGSSSSVPAAHKGLLAALGATDMMELEMSSYVDRDLTVAMAPRLVDLAIQLMAADAPRARRPRGSSGGGGGGGGAAALPASQQLSASMKSELHVQFACTLLQFASCCATSAASPDSKHALRTCLVAAPIAAARVDADLMCSLLPWLVKWGAPGLMSCVANSSAEERADLIAPIADLFGQCFKRCPPDDVESVLQTPPTSTLACFEAIARAADGRGTGPGALWEQALDSLVLALEHSSHQVRPPQHQHTAVQLSACLSAAKVSLKRAAETPPPQALDSALRIGQSGASLMQSLALPCVSGPPGGGGNFLAQALFGGRAAVLRADRSNGGVDRVALSSCAAVVVGRAMRLAARALERAAVSGSGSASASGSPSPAPAEEQLATEGWGLSVRKAAPRLASMASMVEELLPMVYELESDEADADADGGPPDSGPPDELVRQLGALHDSWQAADQQLTEAEARGDARRAASSTGAEAMRALLQRPAATGLAQQMEALGQALCSRYPTDLGCNNPDCTEMGGTLSEAQLVVGKAHRCSGCRTARYCSRTCQVAHWRAHKSLCRRLGGVKPAVVSGGSKQSTAPK